MKKKKIQRHNLPVITNQLMTKWVNLFNYIHKDLQKDLEGYNLLYECVWEIDKQINESDVDLFWNLKEVKK